MTGPGDWFSSDIVTALGLALVHFIWQGAAIAILAFAALSLTRTSTIRYLFCVCALALMLAAPLATFLIVSSPAQVVPAMAIADKMDDHAPAGLSAACPAQKTFHSIP